MGPTFAIALALSAAIPALSQTLRFDVASVKVDNTSIVPGVRESVAKPMEGGPGSSDPGRVTYRRMDLLSLLVQAYGVPGDQIAGPASLMDRSRHYVVEATFAPTTTKEQLRLMLQNLLVERLHIQLHHETRDFPGYALTIAPGGPKFARWTPDPKVPPATVLNQPLLPGQSGEHLTYEREPPGITVTIRKTMAEFVAELRGFQVMSENAQLDTERNDDIAAALRDQTPIPRMDRFIDQTGLDGEWELNLSFGGSMIPTSIFPMNPHKPPTGPPLAEALEEQLGLKLVKVKSVSQDVIVVDRFDPIPTEN